jgi:hypothetical protein
VFLYDFAEGRRSPHARSFVCHWKVSIVCADHTGFDALSREGVTEVGCMAQARRKFHALHNNPRSEMAAETFPLGCERQPPADIAKVPVEIMTVESFARRETHHDGVATIGAGGAWEVPVIASECRPSSRSTTASPLDSR